MSIKVNIKTNVANSQNIDYLQIGTADKVGRFTGLIYDQADNSGKSSATLYVIADKVVDYALDLGFKNCYIQQGKTATTKFVPHFDGTNVY